MIILNQLQQKKKDLDEHWKTKTKDYSADISDDDNQNSKPTWKKDRNKTKDNNTTSSTHNRASTNTQKTPTTPQAPVVDLLGNDVDFTPFVQAPQDIEFGQFQEAISPTSPIQPSLWPTSTQSSSSLTFDPFASIEPSTNEFDFFKTQPQQQQSFIPPSMSQQQPNKSNTNSLNNTWSSAQGKLDISLNNLIPHTRGDPQKSFLPLNQLTSPTGTQSIFSTPNKK